MLATDLWKICLGPFKYIASLSRSKPALPPIVCSIRDHRPKDMPRLRIILPDPSHSPSKEAQRIFAEISFQDDLMMRNALKAIPQPPPEEVPIFLRVPIAESPTYTRSSFSSFSSSTSMSSQPSSPYMEIKFETGILTADNIEGQIRQNRKLTMDLLTGAVETRERRLKWAETLEILEGKRDPEPLRDWGWQCGLAPHFNEFDRLRRKYWHWEAELSRMYERRIVPRVDAKHSHKSDRRLDARHRSSEVFHGGKFLRDTLLSSLPPSSQAQLASWTPDCSVHLLRLERDGPRYDRITKIRNLDACSDRVYREEMTEMADRKWCDTIIVMRPGENLPRSLMIPRTEPHFVTRWGANMF